MVLKYLLNQCGQNCFGHISLEIKLKSRIFPATRYNVTIAILSRLLFKIIICPTTAKHWLFPPIYILPTRWYHESLLGHETVICPPSTSKWVRAPEHNGIKEERISNTHHRLYPPPCFLKPSAWLKESQLPFCCQVTVLHIVIAI